MMEFFNKMKRLVSSKLNCILVVFTKPLNGSCAKYRDISSAGGDVTIGQMQQMFLLLPDRGEARR